MVTDKQHNKKNSVQDNDRDWQSKIECVELCPLCAMPVFHDDKTCNHCGYVVNMTPAKTKNTNFLPLVFGIAGGVFVCAAIYVAIVNKKGYRAFSEGAQKTAEIAIQEKRLAVSALKDNVSRAYSRGRRVAARARKLRSSLANVSSNVSQARKQLDKASRSMREKLESFASKNASVIGADTKSKAGMQ